MLQLICAMELVGGVLHLRQYAFIMVVCTWMVGKSRVSNKTTNSIDQPEKLCALKLAQLGGISTEKLES